MRVTGSDYLVFKSILYFSAIEDIGSKLFRTDGTLAGTYAITNPESDLVPSFEPEKFFELGGWLYMVNNGRLWRSDGSDHSLSQVSTASYQLGNYPVVLNDDIFFTDQTADDSLWIYDTSAQTARKFFDCRTSDMLSSGIEPLIRFNGWLYFTCDDGVHGLELWATDGTLAHTPLYADLEGAGGSHPKDMTVFRDGLLFIATDNQYGSVKLEWTAGMSADGQPGEIVSVLEQPGSPTKAAFLGELDGNDLFFAPDGLGQSTLWSLSDPHAAPQPISLLEAPVISYLTPGMQKVNARLYKGQYYFNSNGPLYGNEVWATDGTPEGTRQVADVWPGSEGSDPGSFAVCDQRLCFEADDGDHGYELWSTEGTAARTGLVEDMNLRAPDSWPKSITSSNGLAYFIARDGIHGSEPWRSDGTPEGTFLLKDIYPGKTGSIGITDTLHFIAFNGQTYFFADDGIHGSEPWVTNGTPEGTHLVSDLTPGPGRSYIYDMVPAGDHLFIFTAFHNALYAVDQNNEVTSINAVPDPLYHPSIQTVFEDRLLFTRYAPAGETIWISDGTAAGTHPVLDGMLWQYPLYWATADRYAVIIGSNNSGTYGVWIVDDAFAEAQRITGDGFHPSEIAHPVSLNGKVYFFAKEASSYNLYQVDPVRGEITLVEGFPGTEYIFDVFAFRGKLMFTLPASPLNLALYSTNGTTSGTRQVAILPEYGGFFTQAGMSLYFIGMDPSTDLLALWVWEDGPLSPRVAFHTPEVNLLNSGLAVTGSSLVFAADDFQSGYEPWVMDIEPVKPLFLPIIER